MPAGEEVAEGRSRDVEVGVAALDEIHRHVKGVVDVALVAHALLEGEGQHAGTGIVRVAPDLRAVAEEAVRLAVGEGRLAKRAEASGCSARLTRSFFTMSASEAKSRFTCTVVVRNIMSSPLEPTFGM